MPATTPLEDMVDHAANVEAFARQLRETMAYEGSGNVLVAGALANGMLEHAALVFYVAETSDYPPMVARPEFLTDVRDAVTRVVRDWEAR